MFFFNIDFRSDKIIMISSPPFRLHRKFQAKYFFDKHDVFPDQLALMALVIYAFRSLRCACDRGRGRHSIETKGQLEAASLKSKPSGSLPPCHDQGITEISSAIAVKSVCVKEVLLPLLVRVSLTFLRDSLARTSWNAS